MPRSQATVDVPARTSRFEPARARRVRGFRARKLADQVAAYLVGLDDPVELAVLGGLERDAFELAARARGERGWTGR